MTDDWFSLKLTQGETSGDFEFSIFIDDIKIYSTINTKPEVRVSGPDFFFYFRNFFSRWSFFFCLIAQVGALDRLIQKNINLRLFSFLNPRGPQMAFLTKFSEFSQFDSF